MASNNKDTNYDIFNFLNETFVEKGKKYTHTSMGKPTGSYYIENENIDIFNELYQTAIFDGKRYLISFKSAFQSTEITSGLASAIRGAKTELPLQKEITGISFLFSFEIISTLY